MVEQPFKARRQRRVAGVRLASLPAPRTFGAEHRLDILAQCRCQSPLIARRCLQFGKCGATAMVKRPRQRVALGSCGAQRRPGRRQSAFGLIAGGGRLGPLPFGFGQC